MTEYDNELSGALFKNDKQGVENRADYRGSATVGRTEYWIDAWLKTSKKGDKFMSLRFKPKLAREYKGAAPNPPDRTADAAEMDSDIPF